MAVWLGVSTQGDALCRISERFLLSVIRLSYTSFSVDWVSAHELTLTKEQLKEAGGQAAYNISVTNTGTVTSSVSILAFLSFEGDTAAPLPHPQRELLSFCRLHALTAGQTERCELAVAPSVVAHNLTIFSGAYSVSVEVGDGTSIRGRLIVE